VKCNCPREVSPCNNFSKNLLTRPLKLSALFYNTGSDHYIIFSNKCKPIQLCHKRGCKLNASDTLYSAFHVMCVWNYLWWGSGHAYLYTQRQICWPYSLLSSWLICAEVEQRWLQTRKTNVPSILWFFRGKSTRICTHKCIKGMKDYGRSFKTFWKGSNHEKLHLRKKIWMDI
jgi:hypothetical protein